MNGIHGSGAVCRPFQGVFGEAVQSLPHDSAITSLELHPRHRAEQVCLDRCGHGRRTVLSPDLKAEKLERLGEGGIEGRGHQSLGKETTKGNSGLGRGGGAEAGKQSLCGRRCRITAWALEMLNVSVYHPAGCQRKNNLYLTLGSL